MRLIAILLFVMAAVLVHQTVAEEYLEKCVQCFLYSTFDPVCAKKRGTYWNLCALDCDQATFLHPGFCTVEDLMDLENREYLKFKD